MGLELDTDIPWKWEEIPIQIKSDSVVGSEDAISIDMNRPEYVMGIVIDYSSPITFSMPFCTSDDDNSQVYEDLPVQPPVEVDKIWTFTKTDAALIITCNGVEVLNYKFADSKFSNCVPKWGGDTTESIWFESDGWNSASDSYRAGKISFIGINLSSFE